MQMTKKPPRHPPGRRTARSHQGPTRRASVVPVWVGWFAVAAILAAGSLAYSNSFAGVFLFDDNWSIVDNSNIRTLNNPWEVIVNSRRPVLNLSLAVNYAVGELDVWGYHAVNLAIHLVAALVLFGLIRGSLVRASRGGNLAEAAPWISMAAATLWVVHPLQTQSVTYVIQRGESLMGLFYLLTLYCVMRGAASPRAGRWYTIAIVGCALGMGTKAVMVTAPFVVLAYDRIFLAGSLRKLLRRRWPLYAGLGGTCFILVFCGVVRGVLFPMPGATGNVGFAYKGVSAGEYAVSQPAVILHYLKLCLWPKDLCLDYRWAVAGDTTVILLTSAVIMAMLTATVWAFRRNAPLAFLAHVCHFAVGL